MGVGVSEAVLVGLCVLVGVKDDVGDGVVVLVKVPVGVAVAVTVTVLVGGRVSVGVGVEVKVEVVVSIGVSVNVGVSVIDFVTVGVAVGDWQNMDAVAVPTLPPPDTNRSRVPNRPLVLMLVEAFDASCILLLAIGVPFKFKVQVPGAVMEVPVLVMVNVPCASGVQFAESEKVGGIGVAVGVGDWQNVDAVAVPTLPPPDANRSSVPKSPLVLMLKEALAASWKLLLAIGVPFRFKVHVPGAVMEVPMLVMVNDPCASAVQLADREKVGGTFVAVAVGDSQNVDAVTVPTLPPPDASRSRVPKRPLVLMLVEAFAASRKLLLAIGVPFKFKVQVPALGIFPPILDMVNVPCASGVQFAEREKVGGTGVSVGVGDKVAVGDWQNVVAVAVPTLPPPDTEISRVPKRPLVLILVDAFANSWKLLLAIGVPFRLKVQVPALVMSPPVLVMTIVPCASGVQFAVIDKTGIATWAFTGN